jgi:hypothetical protein
VIQRTKKKKRRRKEKESPVMGIPQLFSDAKRMSVSLVAVAVFLTISTSRFGVVNLLTYCFAGEINFSIF